MTAVVEAEVTVLVVEVLVSLLTTTNSPAIAAPSKAKHDCCHLLFRPVPKITLRKKGIHAMLGQTTGNINRLVINSFGPDDTGKYKCKASDQSGQSDTKSTIITMEGIKLFCDWSIRLVFLVSTAHSY